MPVYNGEKYLKASIESVLSQSFHDLEFLAIDDGSTDSSKNIIEEYQKKDNRIVYLKNKENIGLQKTLNKGLSFCKGEYIARIDSDDIWCDGDKLRKQINFLEKNPDYALIGTDMEMIGESGEKIQTVRFKKSDAEIRNSILFSSPFAHPSVLINMKALQKMGFYSTEEKHRNVEDYELWLRLGMKYKFANLHDISLKYRIHSDSASVRNELRQRIAWIWLTREYAGFYPHGTQALLAKIVSLLIPRNLLDFLTKKSRLFTALYSKISGIQKKSD